MNPYPASVVMKKNKSDTKKNIMFSYRIVQSKFKSEEESGIPFL